MKEKITIAIILILTILMSGCAVQQQAMRPDQEVELKVKSPTTIEQTTPIEQATPTTPTTTPVKTTKTAPVKDTKTETTTSDYNLESLTKDQQRKVKLVRNLLQEASTKDENYFFRYSGPGILQTDVWAKGNVVKRAIIRANEVDKFKHYNMVYMYKDTKKAWGYCETTKAKCWMGKGPFDEKYPDRIIKTPKDWVLELGDEFTWALDNKIANQLYHIVDFRKDGKTIRVYVNDYRGIPYKVEVYNKQTPIDSVPTGTADEEYVYDDMDIGGVTDDDITPNV